MSAHVSHISLRRVPHLKIVPDTYKFTPETKFNLWQRIALWVLRDFKNPQVDEVVEIQRVEIDRERFMDKVFEMDRALRTSFHGEGEWLIIGAEDFSEVMGSREISEMAFRFDASYKIKRAPYEQAQVCGLRVFVLPWVRGMFVTPDLTKMN